MQIKTKYLIWAVVFGVFSFVFINQVSLVHDSFSQAVDAWYFMASVLSGMGSVGLLMAYFSEY